MDRVIYMFFDRWASYFQSRHGWNLLKVMVFIRFWMLVFSTGFLLKIDISKEYLPFIVFVVVINSTIGFVMLQSSLKTFYQNTDYFNDIENCYNLNVEAVFERYEYLAFRLFWLGLTAALLPLGIYRGTFSDALWITWAVLTNSHNYLKCCMFLGPGEHSKELNKKIADNSLPQRSEG